jgi:hypothetical protein
MGGRSKEKQELAETRIPLSAKIAVLQSRSGDDLIRRLFGPLGYEVVTQRHELDHKFPEWVKALITPLR